MATAVRLVLLLAGLYLLLDHRYSPFNHEAIGLGTSHMMHSIAGIIIILVAIFALRKRKIQKAVPTRSEKAK